MQKILLRCCISLLLISLPVSAQQPVDSPQQRKFTPAEIMSDIQRVAGRMQSEWMTCQSSGDCALVSFNCTEALAVNKGHSKEVQNEICKTEFCSWLKCVPKYSFSATCEEGQCITKSEPVLEPN